MILCTWGIKYIYVGLAVPVRFCTRCLYACWTILLLLLSVHTMLADGRICVSALPVLMDVTATLSLYGCMHC